MSGTRHLTPIAIIAVHDLTLTRFGGGEKGIRDLGNIEYICQHVKERLEEDIVCRAAFLLKTIADQHPFFDGNKRTALFSCFIFLRLNGYYLYDLGSNEAEAFVLELAKEETKHNYSLEDVATWLRRFVRKKPTS